MNTINVDKSMDTTNVDTINVDKPIIDTTNVDKSVKKINKSNNDTNKPIDLNHDAKSRNVIKAVPVNHVVSSYPIPQAFIARSFPTDRQYRNFDIRREFWEYIGVCIQQSR